MSSPTKNVTKYPPMKLVLVLYILLTLFNRVYIFILATGHNIKMWIFCCILTGQNIKMKQETVQIRRITGGGNNVSCRIFKADEYDQSVISWQRRPNAEDQYPRCYGRKLHLSTPSAPEKMWKIKRLRRPAVSIASRVVYEQSHWRTASKKKDDKAPFITQSNAPWVLILSSLNILS